MGGARRGLNGALCVTAGTSSNPRLRRVTPEKRKKKEEEGADLRLEQTPASPPSLISTFSYFCSFLTLFLTTLLLLYFFASYQLGTSDQIWVLDKLTLL